MPPKPRILVVDDDGPIVILMRSLLKEFGFEPVTAMSGREAIEAAREQTPDLVLLDRNMPGMSGDEVIRALRDDLGLTKTPILILSGEPIAGREILDLRADGAVQKPFDVVSLVEKIRAHVL